MADRGLCGGYNANVLRAVDRMIKSKASDVEYRVVTSGKKAPPYLRYRGIHPEQSFMGMSDRPTFEDARRDRVRSEGTLRRRGGRPGSSGLDEIPFRRHPGRGDPPDPADPRRFPYLRGGRRRRRLDTAGPRALRRAHGGYTEFEPDGIDILDELVARYVEAAVFQAMLEAAASEHTARQRAMAAATENADELTKTLTRIMNRARQDAITTEIMEIVGGAEALRQGPEEE